MGEGAVRVRNQVGWPNLAASASSAFASDLSPSISLKYLSEMV